MGVMDRIHHVAKAGLAVLAAGMFSTMTTAGPAGAL